MREIKTIRVLHFRSTHCLVLLGNKLCRTMELTSFWFRFISGKVANAAV